VELTVLIGDGLSDGESLVGGRGGGGGGGGCPPEDVGMVDSSWSSDDTECF
jgi:hypothetical protein